jgi:hypothetical protein
MKVMGNIVRSYENVFFFFFFPQICDGKHSQGNLAMFGYRPTMKVRKLLGSFYILASCLNNV